MLPVSRPYGRREVTLAALAESQPREVGEFVRWLVSPDCAWTVEAPDGADLRTRVRRPIAPRDVCLLFRRFVHFGRDVTRHYVEALEARGVPHLLVGGRSFHEREEVDAMRAALTAIEWPEDELSVYAALTGPFFALGEEALLEYHGAAGGFHPYRVPADLPGRSSPVARALQTLRHLVERGVVSRLVQGEHVHQIEVPRVVAADVAVEAEIAVVLALVPELRRRDAVDQPAVAQHRQVEAAAIPGHELGNELLDAVVELLDRGLLVALRLADREHLDPLVAAQHAGNDHDPVQVRREEIAPGLRAPLLERDLGDLGVRQRIRQLIQAPDAAAVRDRLDVESENRCQSGKTPVER